MWPQQIVFLVCNNTIDQNPASQGIYRPRRKKPNSSLRCGKFYVQSNHQVNTQSDIFVFLSVCYVKMNQRHDLFWQVLRDEEEDELAAYFKNVGDSPKVLITTGDGSTVVSSSRIFYR